MNEDFEHFYPLANAFNGWWYGDIESYEVVDEYTFRVNMKQPNSEFIRRLSQGGFGSSGMISPKTVETHGNEEAHLHGAGTGPFKLTERVFGEKIVMERNADYWDPNRVPRVDRLIIRGIPDVATRELALLTGEVDIIATPSPDSTDFPRVTGHGRRHGADHDDLPDLGQHDVEAARRPPGAAGALHGDRPRGAVQVSETRPMLACLQHFELRRAGP